MATFEVVTASSPSATTTEVQLVEAPGAQSAYHEVRNGLPDGWVIRSVVKVSS